MNWYVNDTLTAISLRLSRDPNGDSGNIALGCASQILLLRVLQAIET